MVQVFPLFGQSNARKSISPPRVARTVHWWNPQLMYDGACVSSKKIKLKKRLRDAIQCVFVVMVRDGLPRPLPLQWNGVGRLRTLVHVNSCDMRKYLVSEIQFRSPRLAAARLSINCTCACHSGDSFSHFLQRIRNGRRKTGRTWPYQSSSWTPCGLGREWHCLQLFIGFGNICIVSRNVELLVEFCRSTVTQVACCHRVSVTDLPPSSKALVIQERRSSNRSNKSPICAGNHEQGLFQGRGVVNPVSTRDLSPCKCCRVTKHLQATPQHMCGAHALVHCCTVAWPCCAKAWGEGQTLNPPSLVSVTHAHTLCRQVTLTVGPSASLPRFSLTCDSLLDPALPSPFLAREQLRIPFSTSSL